jgi:hypothetical protein
VSSDHASADNGEVCPVCGDSQLKASSEHAADQGEPGYWTLRIFRPGEKLRSAAMHYRAVAPASLAVYIPLGQVQGQKLWALVVVIAILAVTDMFVARRTP